MTDLTMNQSVPGFSYDMAGAILSSTMLLASEAGDDVLLIETEFVEDERIIDGYFFFIPEEQTLNKMLQALGMKDHE
jgi:chemotaxis protein CheC